MILPWPEVERVEFQPASGGPAFLLGEVAWNNALLAACQRLEAMDPLKTLVVNLGLTWAAFASARRPCGRKWRGCGRPDGPAGTCRPTLSRWCCFWEWLPRFQW